MKKQLKIKLLPNGEIQMETKGIKGKKCLKYVDFLEEIADAKTYKQDFTSEYYEQDTVIDTNQNEQQNLYE